MDFSGRDVGGYVEEAKKSVASLKIPEGYRLEWSGEYEYLVKTHERLKMVIPLTLLIIFVLHLLQHAFSDKDCHRASCSSFFPCRFLLASLSLELQHEHCRLGRYHRPCGTRRGDRGCYASLSRSCSRTMEPNWMRASTMGSASMSTGIIGFCAEAVKLTRPRRGDPCLSRGCAGGLQSGAQRGRRRGDDDRRDLRASAARNTPHRARAFR